MVQRELTKNDLSTVVSETNLVDTPKEWILDTGATCHVCSDENAFSTYEPANGRKLHMGN